MIIFGSCTSTANLNQTKVMNPTGLIVLSILSVFACSCSAVKLKNRKGLDIYLDINSSNQLRGNYKNSKQDSAYDNSTLFNNFDQDSTCKNQGLIVNVTPIATR